jgi:hypothetical protein
VEKRNRYLAGLIRKPTSEVSEADEANESDHEDAEVKENKNNEKLLKRLYQAAERDIEQDQGNEEAEAVNDEKENVLGKLNKGLIDVHTKTDRSVHNYESWVRTKEHQEKLKKVLVMEAKKDMYEKLVKKQAELDQLN